jgi:hypothetical protein
MTSSLQTYLVLNDSRENEWLFLMKMLLDFFVLYSVLYLACSSYVTYSEFPFNSSLYTSLRFFVGLDLFLL